MATLDSDKQLVDKPKNRRFVMPERFKSLKPLLTLYKKSDLGQFYLDVKKGDILCFTNSRRNEIFRYGVFISEGGLSGTSRYDIVHFQTTPTRVERTFLKKLSYMAKYDVKNKSAMLTAVKNYYINEIGINSIEEMFSFEDKVKIDNDMDTFWTDVTVDYETWVQDCFEVAKSSRPGINEWIEILKNNGE